jgi:predicted ArsR family transcriptional regulator
LTSAANRVFPDAHALLTVGLLESLQEVYGDGGMRKLLDARTRHQREEYGQAVPPEASLKDKVKALARLRDREGYMTEVGAGAVVTREEHLLSGGRRCVYEIQPAGKTAPAANRKGQGK